MDQAKADADRLKFEADRIRGQQHRYKTQAISISKEMMGLDPQINELEMKCYMNGSDLCLNHHDTYLLNILDVNRKIDKLNIDKNKECWTVIPFSIRPKSEFEWQAKTQEVLTEYKKYVECSKKYYESNLVHMQEKLTLKRQILKKLSEFKFT